MSIKEWTFLPMSRNINNFSCFQINHHLYSSIIFIMPNLVNLWSFIRIHCKLINIWDPKLARKYTPGGRTVPPGIVIPFFNNKIGKLHCRGPIVFKIYRILMKLQIFTKYSMINQVVGFIFCLNETNWKSWAISKKIHCWGWRGESGNTLSCFML